MKLLTEHFSRVVVINCPHRPDRLERVVAHLQKFADMGKVEIVRGVVGDWVTCPADWNSGAGAWGCLRTHQRVIEDFIHVRDDREQMALDSLLVLEDDVVFADDALARLEEFMEVVPDDWGQIYLGGQHRSSFMPTTFACCVVGRSVNRTHAYAVHARAICHLYRHISYASDYRGTTKHIDHQLELAHHRADWKVYCIEPWIAGQAAGSSNVSGKTNGLTFFDNAKHSVNFTK